MKLTLAHKLLIGMATVSILTFLALVGYMLLKGLGAFSG
jgi:hypothetical protein